MTQLFNNAAINESHFGVHIGAIAPNGETIASNESTMLGHNDAIRIARWILDNVEPNEDADDYAADLDQWADEQYEIMLDGQALFDDALDVAF